MEGNAIGSLERLWEELEDGLAVVALAMASSSVHLEKVKLWQTRFEKVEELFREVSGCQERWRRLEKSFAQMDRKLNEAVAFQSADGKWKALLSRVASKPNVIQLALDPESSQSFRQLREASEAIAQDLERFLEAKPRAHRHISSLSYHISYIELN